jgi:CBS-domain-containing membrane protein
LRTQIGEENIFYADNKLFQSTELALARAWSIVETENKGTLPGAHPTELRELAALSAGDLMSRRCIRFGNQHQLREAIWLMSEMYERTQPDGPQPLFLQDREGRLAGELSTWRILSELLSGIDPQRVRELDDTALGKHFRSHFDTSIDAMAATVDGIGVEATFAQLIENSVGYDRQFIPVRDSEGRILGLVQAASLLKELHRALDQERTSI